MHDPAPPGAAGAPSRPARGFRTAGSLLADSLRHAGARRGLPLLRLLGRWEEVAGAELAAVTRPLRIGWGREGFGATLTLLVAPGAGPRVQMALPLLRERVNACLGQAGVARIALTHTAPEGFGEGADPFRPAPPAPRAAPAPEPAAEEALTRAAVAAVSDARLRAALARLGAHVLTRHRATKGL